jgi:hypothetical protein
MTHHSPPASQATANEVVRWAPKPLHFIFVSVSFTNNYFTDYVYNINEYNSTTTNKPTNNPNTTTESWRQQLVWARHHQCERKDVKRTLAPATTPVVT